MAVEFCLAPAHPFPYQGSKRKLAPFILRFIPKNTACLIEPFAGSAAISIAAAATGRAERFLLNDIHRPLIDLWREILSRPRLLCEKYHRLWKEQKGQERLFYDKTRTRFNREHRPEDFLYLLARCVKAAVRYNGKGEFNNSPDNRRIGMHPAAMLRNIMGVSQLLSGLTDVRCDNYTTVLATAGEIDLVYMDPPYQGVCGTHNHRYHSGVDLHEFVESLAALNHRSVSYIISYDGRTGRKSHGRKLPRFLNLVHEEIFAGRSTQATLLGRKDETFESIYLSPALVQRLGKDFKHLPISSQPQLQLFA